MNDEALPRVGEVLAGKYRVERVLGVGGMGAVIGATHCHLDGKVAIKMLHQAMAQNAEIVARFVREGKAVTKIRSEHAVKVHDVGTLENGAPYLVMEHLEGEDLSQILEKRGRLPAPEVVDLILQACEAIAEAHALGIVHRDLKPANLFLTHRADGSPCLKVLDFGISKAASHEDVAMTRTQAVMGSPRYMSPEQMRSTRHVDARTDIWALGTIVYELLTGAPPFGGETMTELCAQILQDTPRPLTHVAPGLDAVVARCLAKSPEERFADLAQLSWALAEFGTASARASAERVGRVLASRGVSTDPTRSSPTVAVWGTGTAPPAPPKNTGVFIALALGALVVVGALVAGGAVLLTRPKPIPAAQIAPPPVVAMSTTPPVELPPPPPPPASTSEQPPKPKALPPRPTATITATAPKPPPPPPAPTADPFEARH